MAENIEQKEQGGESLIRAYASLVARANLAASLGQSYGGDRDLYEALGYTPQSELVYGTFVQQYRRQDIAKAIIDRPVKVTWSGDITVVETKIDDSTPLELEWQKLWEDLKLKSKFIRLDKLTGLGKYGIFLLGFDDVSNAKQYTRPVRKKTKNWLKGGRRLLYVRPLGEASVEIDTWEKDVSNERYGLPLLYSVTLLDGKSNEMTEPLKVHYTRILHIMEGQLESETEGVPRLESVFNRLQDLEKLVGGSAEMFWRGARPGYSGEIAPDHTMSTEDEAALKEQIDEYENNLRRLLINQGVKLSALDMQIANPKDHVDVQLSMISAVTGIPKRILSGSERGELSSSQDSNEWTSYVQGRREEFAEPHIVRPFIDRMIEVGVLPEAKDRYTIEWDDLFSISEKEKVLIGRTRATALREYFVNPITPQLIPLKAFYQFFLGFKRSQVEAITKMKPDDAYRKIREEDARFQAELKAGTESVVIPENDEGAQPEADKKTKTKK